jgi:ATP-binding cassette subfamily B protein
VKPVLPRLIGGFLVALGAAVVSLIIPLVLQFAVDGPIASGNTQLIILSVTGVLILGILEAVFVYLRRAFVLTPATGVEYAIRQSFYQRLQRLPVAFHDKWQSGQLLSRMMQDINLIRRWLAFGSILLVVNVLTVIIGTFLLFRWHWSLGVTFLVVSIPLWFFGYRFEERYGVLTRQSQDQAGDLATAVEESVHGIRVLKAFGRGKHALQKFTRQVETLRGTEMNKAKEVGILWFWLEAVPVVAFGLCLLLGIWLVSSDQLTVGELFAFFAMATALRWPLESLGFLFSFLVDTRTATDRVFEVLDEENDIVDPADPKTIAQPRGELAFRDVHFRYPDAAASESDLLNGVDLVLEPGETMALVGLTGSGKTTLTTLPTRLYDVTEGRLELDGVDVRDLRLDELRTHIAMAFEDATLFSTTVRENVLIGRDGLDPRSPEAEAVLSEALDIAQAGFAYDLPDGVDTMVGEEGPAPRACDDDGAHRRAPALDRGARGPGRRARGRPHHGRRDPFGAAARQRALPARDLEPRGRGRRAAGKTRTRSTGDGGEPVTTVVGTRGEDRHDYTKAESRAIRRRSLKLLGSLIQPMRGLLVLTALVIVASTGLRVLGPSLIAWGIDQALPQAVQYANWMPAFMVSALYIATGAIGAGLLAWYVMLSARLTQAVLMDLRTRIFRHTQRLSLEFHESYTSGRIISRQTSDLESIRELLDGGLNQLVQGSLYGVFTLVALFFLDWQSGLILVLMGIPLSVLMRWFYIESQKGFRASRVVSAKLIVQFVETMTGVRAVKAFRKEKRNDAEFGQISADYRSVNLRLVKLYGVLDPGMILLANVTLSVVLLWGAFRVADGQLAVGVLLGALLYVRNFFSPLEEVAMFLNSYQSATAALEKVSGVLEEEPSVPDPIKPVDLWTSTGHVRFDDVEFGYASGRTILPDFTLDIPAGQTIALVGTTGAGKSTLAKLVSRFYDPTRGRVTLDGVDLRDLHPKDLRRAIVMVTQEAYLFSGTVADNIALGKPDATLDEIRAAARAVGADGFIQALPDGYDTDVNKRGGRVSAGQRQLISFARAFLADPAVLILDEATASLDIPSERLIQEALQTLLADRTAIIIAHRLSTVAIADRVLVMEHGRIIEDDDPETLIAGTGKFAQLHSAWRASLV